MHYGEIPRATMGSSDHLWGMKYLRYSKKNLLLNFKPVFHDVTTLHETFSAKLLSHDVISLECETKHTNLTLVNERQNNLTSCTNCSYLISTFIPLDE
jgi:hypothetical protein